MVTLFSNCLENLKQQNRNERAEDRGKFAIQEDGESSGFRVWDGRASTFRYPWGVDAVALPRAFTPRVALPTAPTRQHQMLTPAKRAHCVKLTGQRGKGRKRGGKGGGEGWG